MRTSPFSATFSCKGKENSFSAEDFGWDVQYSFSGANTNTADRYEGEFQVTYSDSSIQTFPNNTYIDITVTDDVE